MAEKATRLVFLDVARLFAILLAILFHALLATAIYTRLGEKELLIRQFTRLGTPMFVFIFGC